MWVKRLTAGVRGTLCISMVALGAAGGVRANDSGLQPLERVRAAAEQAVRHALDPLPDRVRITAGNLDPRLRLAACAAPLGAQATAPRGNQARVLTRVSCTSPAWTINLPVDLERTHSILVARRALARGETVTAADVTAASRVLPGVGSPFIASLAELDARVTRRPIPAGTALPADAFAAAILIHRGQTVTLTAASAGFEVRAPGRAMADAAAGARVRVQNLQSLKIIEGVADSESTVRIVQ